MAERGRFLAGVWSNALAGVAAALVSLFAAGTAMAQDSADASIRYHGTLGGGALLIACGLWVFQMQRRARVAALASVGWPTVKGSIVDSGVIVTEGVNASSCHAPRVRYVYEVAGVRHDGHVIGLGDRRAMSKHEAQAICDSYPAGASVAVHYDPKNPGSAILTTSPPDDYRLWTGGALVTAGVAMIIYALLQAH